MLVHRGGSCVWCAVFNPSPSPKFTPDTLLPSRADGSLTLFSPFDPIYLTISYLSSLPSRFQSYSDLWESIAQHRFEVQGMKKEEEGKEDEGAAFAEDLGRLDAMEGVKERLKAVCETQGAALFLSQSQSLRR